MTKLLVVWIRIPRKESYCNKLFPKELKGYHILAFFLTGVNATQVFIWFLHWTAKDSQGYCIKQEFWSKQQENAERSGTCWDDSTVPGGWPAYPSQYYVSSTYNAWYSFFVENNYESYICMWSHVIKILYLYVMANHRSEVSFTVPSVLYCCHWLN